MTTRRAKVSKIPLHTLRDIVIANADYAIDQKKIGPARVNVRDTVREHGGSVADQRVAVSAYNTEVKRLNGKTALRSSLFGNVKRSRK